MLTYSAAYSSVLQRLRSLALGLVVAVACATLGAIVARAQALPIAYWVFEDVGATTPGGGVRVNGYGIDPSDRPVISSTDGGTTWSAPEKIGRAFSFDGTGYARTTYYAWHADATFLPGPNAFSMQAWIRTSRTTGFQVVAGQAQAAGNQYHGGPAGYYLGIDEGRVVAWIRDVNWGSTALTGPSVADGQFHHVALVRDMAVLELRLYLDGALAASQTLVGGAEGDVRPNDLTDSPFSIGFMYTFWGTADGTPRESPSNSRSPTRVSRAKTIPPLSSSRTLRTSPSCPRAGSSTQGISRRTRTDSASGVLTRRAHAGGSALRPPVQGCRIG